jgi:hypothetical protein
MHKNFQVYNFLIKSVYGSILLIFTAGLIPLYAQEPPKTNVLSPDTIEVADEADTIYHSPQKAAMYSALLPGLGQIYNRKYWKLPIIYAGFGTLGYFIVFNNIHFKEFRQAYKDFPDYKLDYSYPLNQEQIERGMYFYKRYRDLSIIGTFGFYIFQIIDATVDAHLFNWDVGEDISLNIQPSLTKPSIYGGTNSFGVRACLSF